MASSAGVVPTVQQAGKSSEELTTEPPDVDPNGSATVAVDNPGPSDPNPRLHPIKTGPSSPKNRSTSICSLPDPCAVSQTISRTEGVYPLTKTTSVAAGPSAQPIQNHNLRPPELKDTEAEFRDALEYDDPDQREREREYLERVERRKHRESRFEEWNPIKWITESPHETPKEEHPPFELGEVPGSEKEGPGGESNPPPPMPKGQNPINITDELIVGGLATLMLRLWFERAENGHRRVPILLHLLRIRISDSLHPLDGTKAVFRIECEYADGAARWVIYRQLKEFVSLHTHYTFSSAYNRNTEALPEFPKTSERVIVHLLGRLC